VTVDLADDERQLLVNLITVEIAQSRDPLSPRSRLRRGLSKLGNDQPAKVAATPSQGRASPADEDARVSPRPHRLGNHFFVRRYLSNAAAARISTITTRSQTNPIPIMPFIIFAPVVQHSCLMKPLISSGLAKMISARSPIIPAGRSAGVPLGGPMLLESVLKRRFGSQKSCVSPSPVVM
jgi:hypothetical protein